MIYQLYFARYSNIHTKALHCTEELYPCAIFYGLVSLSPCTKYNILLWGLR